MKNKKSQVAIKAKELSKEVLAKQEKIVIDAREKILPILKKRNLSIDHSKSVCDTLAIVLQQGQFNLAQQHKVSDLKLLQEINQSYPEYETIHEILLAIDEMSTMEGINVLQWMLAKINKLIEDENKNRKLEELKLDF